MDCETSLANIMLIEDDDSLAELVSEYLTNQGYHVTVVNRGDNALPAIMEQNPDLVLLDIMLPGKNGLDVCRELRGQSNVPVIMLTARTDDIDQVVGLEVGADDYICKPVQPRLLLARINSLLRRAKTVEPGGDSGKKQQYQFGSLTINSARQEVTLQQEVVNLTTNEIELLVYFADHPDTVLSRDDLMNQLRGFEYDGLDRTIDMLVSRLRRKLEIDPGKPERIKTIWKKGYLFVSDAW